MTVDYSNKESAMTETATRQTRKTQKPQRRLHISQRYGNTVAVRIDMPHGSKVENFGYYVTQIDSQIGGVGLHFEKFGVEQEEGEPSSYDVHIDTEHQFHACECKGFYRWQHCKHIDAGVRLVNTGRF